MDLGLEKFLGKRGLAVLAVPPFESVGRKWGDFDFTFLAIPRRLQYPDFSEVSLEIFFL